MANIKLFTEKIKGTDKKARWPYNTSLSSTELYNTVMTNLKQQKVGYIFEGWRYNGQIYAEPFDNESTNPFGPITEDTDIYAVWSKINVYCTSDTLVVDFNENYVNINYYTLGSTFITSNEVTLTIVPSETTASYEIVSDTVSGNNRVCRIKINQNQTTETKTLTLYAEYKGIRSETVVITQTADGDILLPSFDYMTFVYTWGNKNENPQDATNDGKDLDSATIIRDSNLALYGNLTLNDVFVGYRGNSSNEVKKYIQHGGDNTSSGNEGAFINWKKVITDMRDNGILEGVNELHLDVYANWYMSKIEGNMKVTFNTYESPNDTGMSLNDFVFTPNEGTTQVSSQISTRPIYVNAFGKMNVGNTDYMKQTYSKVFEVTYYVQSKRAIVKEIRTQSGREVTDIKYQYNDTQKTINNEISGSINQETIDKNSHSGTFTVSNFSQKINGVVDNAYTINPDEITLGYYDPSDMTGYVTFTASVNNGVCTVNWTCQENNTTATKRNCDIKIKVHTAPYDYTLVYGIYQTN